MATFRGGRSLPHKGPGPRATHHVDPHLRGLAGFAVQRVGVTFMSVSYVLVDEELLRTASRAIVSILAELDNISGDEAVGETHEALDDRRALGGGPKLLLVDEDTSRFLRDGSWGKIDGCCSCQRDIHRLRSKPRVEVLCATCRRPHDPIFHLQSPVSACTRRYSASRFCVLVNCEFCSRCGTYVDISVSLCLLY